METSPLLYGQETKTALDLITKRLYFIWPLSKKQIEWLNTVIYKDQIFLINYWSFTHTFFGFLWGLAEVFWSKRVFSVTNYLIFHSLFELWELWAGGYLTGQRALNLAELVDVVMDTLFGVSWSYL